MTASRTRVWRPIGIAAGIALLVAVLGGTITDLGGWYQTLRLPAWKPPDWLFGPAWTLIFSMTALAAAMMWWTTPATWERTLATGLFVLNAILNLAWSWLFFHLERPDWAFAEVSFLWLSIAALIVLVSRHDRRAGWLLIPYLAWVSFAGMLNRAVVDLNGPFK